MRNLLPPKAASGTATDEEAAVAVNSDYLAVRNFGPSDLLLSFDGGDTYATTVPAEGNWDGEAGFGSVYVKCAEGETADYEFFFRGL